jgi:hypothetical protein
VIEGVGYYYDGTFGQRLSPPSIRADTVLEADMAVVSAAAMPTAAEDRIWSAVPTEGVATADRSTAAVDIMADAVTMADAVIMAPLLWRSLRSGLLCHTRLRICRAGLQISQASTIKGGYWHYYRGCAASPYGY